MGVELVAVITASNPWVPIYNASSSSGLIYIFFCDVMGTSYAVGTSKLLSIHLYASMSFLM